VVADETLNIKGSLLSKKLKTQELTENLFETENTVKKRMTNFKLKIKQIRFQLKRTSSRETYANKKILKLEQNINENCCQEKLHRIQYLEHQIKEKEIEINELADSLQYLNDLVNDIDTQQRIVNIYDGEGKRYTSK
jgi:phage shock protein A